MTQPHPQSGSLKLKRRVLSRRQFLDSSARNAAGMAAVGVGAVTLQDSVSASSPTPVRLGVIGVRTRGSALARMFDSLPGVRLEAVCDVDSHQFAPLLDKLEQKRPPRIESDFRRLLDSRDVDAVVIAAPDHWHFEMAKATLEAEKDLYLEVPLTHTLAESRRLQKLHEQHLDRIIQTGLTQRSAAHFRSAIEAVQSGRLGKVSLAKAWATHRRKPVGCSRATEVPAGVDFEAWCGPAGERAFHPNRFHHHWRWFWDFGSGELGNWGVQLLDVAAWGLDVELPVRVSSMGGKFHFEGDQETPDTQQVMYDFGNRTISWEHRQWSPHANEGRSAGVAFYGESGTLIVDRGGWKVYGCKDGEAQDGSDATAEHCRNFLDCVHTRRMPAASLDVAFASSAMCHLGNLAHREGREILVSEILETPFKDV